MFDDDLGNYIFMFKVQGSFIRHILNYTEYNQ